MAIITHADLTAAERMKVVRDLADLSDGVLSDADLTKRIELGDQTARIKWDNQTIPTDQDDLLVFITAANIETAIRILSGLNEDSYVNTCRLYMDQVKSIYKHAAGKAAESNRQMVVKSKPRHWGVPHK